MTAAAGTLPAPLATEASARIWVLWKYGSARPDGKRAKVPFSPQPDTGGKYRKASSDDSATWGSLAEVEQARKAWRGWFDGLGRVLQPGEVGIDLDDCIDQAGQLSPLAQRVVEAFAGRAYIERSVSGRGIHLIVLGSVPAALKTDAVEIYPGGSGRYFTISGNELPGSAAPAEAQQALDQLYGWASAGRQARQTVGALALTAELQAEIARADLQRDHLLRDLAERMPPQLRALLERDELPAALASAVKGGGLSERRACVVAQLCYTRRYSDGQIYVLARALWRRYGYESRKKEQELAADCRRLIGEYRAYWSGGRPVVVVEAPPAPEPMTPARYLSLLAQHADGSAVLLPRAERAQIAQISIPSAQRYEQKLAAEGLIEIYTWAPQGEGNGRGRRGALRILPAGWAALGGDQVKIATLAPDPAPSAEPDQVKDTAVGRAEAAVQPVMQSRTRVVCDMPPALGPDDAAFWSQAAATISAPAVEPQAPRRPRPLPAGETPAERQIKRERQASAVPEAQGYTPRQQRLALAPQLGDWSEADSRLLGACFLPDAPQAADSKPPCSSAAIRAAAPQGEPPAQQAPPVSDAAGLIARLTVRRYGAAATG